MVISISIFKVVCNQEKKMNIKSLSRLKPGIRVWAYDTVHACKHITENVSAAYQNNWHAE